MSDQHDHLVADILDHVADGAASIGQLLGGPWGVPSGKIAAGLLRAGAKALRKGVSSDQLAHALDKLDPLDMSWRAANDHRLNQLPVKP